MRRAGGQRTAITRAPSWNFIHTSSLFLTFYQYKPYQETIRKSFSSRHINRSRRSPRGSPGGSKPDRDMARSRRCTGDTFEGSMLGSEMQSRSPHNATDFLVEISSSAPRSAAHPPLSSSGRELVDGRLPNLPSITDWNSTETPRSGPIKPTLSSLVSNFRFL